MKELNMPNFEVKTMSADGPTPLHDRSSVGTLITNFL